eukprot:m.45733 g.45733  ORF g.45733 m.45733 type:complete len:116 (-) comp7235_c0_seq1:69-416(-)
MKTNDASILHVSDNNTAAPGRYKFSAFSPCREALNIKYKAEFWTISTTKLRYLMGSSNPRMDTVASCFPVVIVYFQLASGYCDRTMDTRNSIVCKNISEIQHDTTKEVSGWLLLN